MFRKYVEEGLEPKSTRPKTNPRETPIRIKERIVELRKRTSKCALKLKWRLEKEGIVIHKNTIQKIIKKEGLTRKYRVRKLKYKYIKVPLGKEDLVEIDIKFVPETIKNLIDPGKPAQNGRVERSHRTDQEMFYDRNKFKTLKDLKIKIKIWNNEYNNLEHCSLNGKTPNEMLKLLLINEPTNVCG